MTYLKNISKPKNLLIPYAESEPETIKSIFHLVKIKRGQKTLDMGSGDGRIVIAMAKRGAEAYGIEIREKYVRRSKWNILKENLEDKAFIHQKDFWEENLNTYDIITIYPMAALMEKLEKKLSKELKSGAIVITNGFRIPGWKTWKEKGFTFVYKKLANNQVL
ncbi:MAG: methyltransferase domain-containing protein [Candidatus Levybacteria bacterium]|nr:methyltransferase domain-containing protein [Candidatus Levybacteria bacterium]MBI2420892.1 methyltransferase domain-containing protein [Candidatus Levybacteria bacterium]